jgi:hypothetical protein
MDIGVILQKIKTLQDEIKHFELKFFKNHDINIVIEDDAIDFVLELVVNSSVNPDDFYNQMNINFEYGLKLVREKTGKNRFFLTRQALINPETFISSLIRDALSGEKEQTERA